MKVWKVRIKVIGKEATVTEFSGLKGEAVGYYFSQYSKQPKGTKISFIEGEKVVASMTVVKDRRKTID